MERGTHAHAHDDRNDRVLVWLNGELVPRDRAMVSVLDSGFILGDGIWEGLRLYNGVVPFLDRHLDRLFEGAAALDLEDGPIRLKSLSLEGAQMADVRFDVAQLSALEALDLAGVGLTERTLRQIASGPLARSLQSFTLNNPAKGTPVAAVFATATWPARSTPGR